LRARLCYARLRQHAVGEDVDYRAPRGLDRALFQKLANAEWIGFPDSRIDLVNSSTNSGTPSVLSRI
jgi:hypothetical protein